MRERSAVGAGPRRGTSLTAVSHIAGAATHAWSASGPRDLARLLRLARRHSAHVRFLRRAVPGGAIAALVIFIGAQWLSGAVAELPVSAGKLVVSGTKITMEAPKLTGFTQDNRAYNITAEAAAQDITNPTIMELTGVHAKIELQSKGVADITSVSGTYDSKTEFLTLTQYVHLITSDGYEGFFTEVRIDSRKNLIVSEKPVEVNLPNGKLNAQRMEIVDGGALMRFDGGIKLVLTGDGSASPKKDVR